MGQVVAADDPWLNRQVAIKLLQGGVEAHPSQLRRFSREAQVTALKVLGCGYAQGFYYSPPVEGKALRELIRQGATLPAAVAAR